MYRKVRHVATNSEVIMTEAKTWNPIGLILRFVTAIFLPQTSKEWWWFPYFTYNNLVWDSDIRLNKLAAEARIEIQIREKGLALVRAEQEKLKDSSLEKVGHGAPYNLDLSLIKDKTVRTKPPEHWKKVFREHLGGEKEGVGFLKQRGGYEKGQGPRTGYVTTKDFSQFAHVLGEGDSSRVHIHDPKESNKGSNFDARAKKKQKHESQEGFQERQQERNKANESGDYSKLDNWYPH